jgi:hypothetical protein
MFGATLSAIAPTIQNQYTGPPTLGYGPAIGIGAGYRWGWFYLGGSYQHAFFGGGTLSVKEQTSRTVRANGDFVGLDLVAITAPEATLAAFFRFSAGMRVINAQMDGGGSRTASNLDVTPLGVGLSIRTGKLRLLPEASFEIGPVTAYASLALTASFDPATATR